ncbi:alpha/beta fold hydrolase [Aeromicrobium sp. Leaf350]|uniref:alpha/beta fold hydrolase n=1 Tax=Aeromicrobium sp. Leaf350 TaxID=2876565 RepID=UPI001E31EEC4|nr:alpha/beta hydrolase [Aeromicrobium sp. Leaf350]
MLLPDLTYVRKGSGPTIVLLHGIGHNKGAWDPIIDDLATRYDVIAPDLSGFGESPAFAGGVPYTMPNAVDHLATQFERWGVTKPHVVGNSLGGAISLELGARGLVSSVTALSPAGFFGPISKVQALLALFVLRFVAVLSPGFVVERLTRTSLGLRLSGQLLYAHPERIPAEAALRDARGLKYCTAFERTAIQALGYSFQHQVPVTTTVAWGTKDLILPYSQAATARERLPHARHVDIPGAGHVPMIDDPQLVTRLIDQTVAEAEEARTPTAA